MKLLRLILFPFVPIYYLVTWLRNRCYDLGWKRSTSYSIPIICVGNLSVGGTGKTPTIEYLIRLLSKDSKIAVLSRGYKRETKGFVIADDSASASSIGDEPFQFFKKFKAITVAVDADRRHGIEQLIQLEQPDVILLDDAFQHRKVNAGLNILLTAYDNLYCDDIVLPTGNLREPRSGSKRADMIMVTKCPSSMSDEEKNQIIKRLKPNKTQEVFFSTIAYSDSALGMTTNMSLSELQIEKFTLVTGIANPKPLVEYLKINELQFDHLQFKDHHQFSDDEIRLLKQRDLIITTEKDYVRLERHFKDSQSLFYLPIQFTIDRPSEFGTAIKAFINSN